MRPEDCSVDLVEREDFGRFAMVVPTGTTIAKIDAVLRAVSWGEAADEHAWLRADAILAAATASDASTEWFEDYRRMVDYAGQKGWLRESDRSIRAHIEYR